MTSANNAPIINERETKMEEVKGITLSTRETVIKKKYGQGFWDELITQVLTQNNLSPGTIFLSGSSYPLKVLMDIDKYIHDKYSSEDKVYQLTIDNARLYAANTYSTIYKIVLKFLKPELLLSKALACGNSNTHTAKWNVIETKISKYTL